MKKLICSLFLIMTALNSNASELTQDLFGISSDDQCKQYTSCRMLKRHIKRDTKKCNSSPTAITLTNLIKNKKVKGRIRYLGAAPAKYGYDTYFNEDGVLVIESRIFIKNAKDFSDSEMNRFQQKLKMAAKAWTASNDFSDFPVKFELKLTTDRRNSHIKPKLVRKFTRGPYFAKWSLNWGVTTMSHEFGHILGLDDEYANNPFGGSSANCDSQSLMCSSNWGNPQTYHYYLILRRLTCK